MEGLWDTGLEKPLSAQSLMNRHGKVEDTAESGADDTGLAHGVSEGRLKDSIKESQAVQYFELKICGSGQLELKNQRRLSRHKHLRGKLQEHVSQGKHPEAVGQRGHGCTDAGG